MDDPAKMKDCPRCVAIRAMMQKQLEQQQAISAMLESKVKEMALLANQQASRADAAEAKVERIVSHGYEGYWNDRYEVLEAGIKRLIDTPYVSDGGAISAGWVQGKLRQLVEQSR